MNTFNIHEAKTHLSRLIEKATTTGEPFIIAKAGQPLVQVSPLDTIGSQVRRLGFLAGQFSVPDDFDQMGGAEIEQMFESKA